jgi:hypothetical protein
MALTPRQQQFYDALVALCRSTGGSVHYSAVAAALGVSPYSAYDMLKLLESKMVVVSEYVLDAATGPGRSSIVFHPRALPKSDDQGEGTRVAERLLQRLREARGANVREALADLLGHLSGYRSPLAYCMGAVAALLLNLRLSGQELLSRPQLNTLISTGEVGVGTLAGLSIGASLAGDREAAQPEALLQSARRLQEQLAALSAEGRQKLADFVHEALTIVRASQV